MIEETRLAGVDPYDALRSPRLPGFVRDSARLRQLAVQLRKLIPFDLAPLLGIEPFIMAKTVGCFLAGEARKIEAGVTEPSAGTETVSALVDVLDRCEGDAGGGAWGYEFDVQTRWAFYPKGSANLIATVFVARGLLEAGSALGDERLIARAYESVDFLVHTLWDEEGEFFRYTPGSGTLIHNANYLGAGLVAAAGRIRDDAFLSSIASRALATSRSAQRMEGWWPYGQGAGLEWIDSFHTAYNLDGLLTAMLCGVDGAADSFRLGMTDWRTHFFDRDGRPYYYRDKPGPAEIHSAATAVDVLARWAVLSGDARLARTVAAWVRDNLIAPDGTTMYRSGGLIPDRRHFVRWGDAHWALALGSLACLEAGKRTPLDRRLGDV